MVINMGIVRNTVKYIKKYYFSINFAIEGILHGARTQKHVRFHLFAAAFLLLFCFTLGIKMKDFIILSIMAGIVIVSEMLNSSIEAVVDIASPEHSEKARIAKDMAAGAVFVAAVISLVVAFYTLEPYFVGYYYNKIEIAMHSAVDIMVAAILIVLIVVIMMKAYFSEGHPLKGGFPSGHSAISFSIFISVTYLTEIIYLEIIFLIIAFTISIGRIYFKVHNFKEVIGGAIIGSSITFILYLTFLKV